MVNLFKNLKGASKHGNECIDDGTRLERRVVIAYTKNYPSGVDMPSFGYCPKCETYISYGRREKDASRIVSDFFMKYTRNFKLEDLVRIEIR